MSFAPTLDRAAIATLVPHHGAMCLLDRVLAWDASSIRCAATSHRRVPHPLALDGALDATAAIEYAAQAMALHGRLSAGDGATPKAGFIAAVRDVVLHVPRLDTVDGELLIDCEQQAGDARQAVYRFEVSSEGGMALCSGRITVVLEPSSSAATGATA